MMSVRRVISGKLVAALLFILTALSAPAPEANRGKVLIVLSSADQLHLREGKTYRTGYYLGELAIPLQKIVTAGFEPVFANPDGNAATYDPSSDDKRLFSNDDNARLAAKKLIEHYEGIKHPRKLADIVREGTHDYVGIFIPGGHAPMEDLVQDTNLGQILMQFHQTGRPTGLICHGPAALLSTLKNPKAFRRAITKGNLRRLAELTEGWPYAGYRMTVFSTEEEKAIEGAGNRLGGYVPFYVANALARAGAHVEHAAPWQSKVVEDRELVTGQQPFSAEAFADAFVMKLSQAGVSARPASPE
jgi:putative intracellular protease/amidase